MNQDHHGVSGLTGAATSSPLTCDTFLNGDLTVYQHKKGYRFSIDAILLAGFIRPTAGNRIIELGCGSGIITLILARRYRDLHLFGVEIQSRLAQLALKNVGANKMGDRVRILQDDIRSLTQKQSHGPVDIIVCNPPFRKIRSGRINPNNEKALARHEIAMALKDITTAARRLVRNRGRLFIIFPSERMTDLLACMRVDRIEPKRMRMVHSHPSDPAGRILVEGVVGGRPGMRIDSPLVIYQADGEYTAEVQHLME